MPKVLCPCHEDTNPSMEAYPDGLYCMVCRAKLTYEEFYKLTGNLLRDKVAPDPKPKEDVASSLRYIATLPKVAIRGLSLPSDDKGYYIVWPNASYYSRRNFSELGSRYTRPSGHRTPLYIPSDKVTSTLLIVEGEINALSVATACPELGVCSPGSAGDFVKKEHIPYYTTYTKQVLVVDEDAAGAIGAIGLSGLLKPLSADVQIVMLKKKDKGGLGDPNEILVSGGKNALRHEILSRIQTKLTSIPGGAP